MLANGVVRTRLDNGLSVTLKESRHAPVASLWVWYRVGSRNEQAGSTGISHWVEHMLFKGTERFPRGVADRLISRLGGYNNAMTYLDWTTYYETLPAADLQLALEIEADRMVNAIFPADETELERTVIISERQGSENHPAWLLHEKLLSTAFGEHPYGHMTVGRLSDLETISREELERHYRQFYAPGNAALVIVGDFDASQVLLEVEALFGALPAQPTQPVQPAPAQPAAGAARPDQAGTDVTLTGPDDTAYLTVGFHAPPALDADFFPLAVVDALLGGARSMSIVHESEPIRSSRLYRALVESGLASQASTYLLPTVDPYLFLCSATLQSGRSLDELEAALLAELDRLIHEPVSDQELRRVVHQTRAQFVYSAESVTSQAFWLGFAEVVADLDWLNGFTASLAAVTAADVQRVAATYLAAGNRIVARYLPDGSAEQEEG